MKHGSGSSVPAKQSVGVSDPHGDSLPGRNDDLIQVIKEYADKLNDDAASRGDLKILSRSIRELRYAFKVFSPYRHRRKITIFGSARTPATAPAYQQAVQLGQQMVRHGWLVVTGAAQGIMEAGHVGAGRDNAMGLNIMLPFEQEANEVIAGDAKLVHMKYFFTRKLMFVKECDAVVCLPGGFGTLDEGLEILTLLQTGKREMLPLVWLDEPGGTYWSSLHEFVVQHLLRTGMISAEDLHLYRVTDDWQTAVNEVVGFFRVYHSMRFVRSQLVFRLQEPLEPTDLETINHDFADILTEGRFEQSGPLSDERDEPELAHLTRLVFAFNRRNLGRLRQLVNHLNQLASDTPS